MNKSRKVEKLCSNGICTTDFEKLSETEGKFVFCKAEFRGSQSFLPKVNLVVSFHRKHIII